MELIGAIIGYSVIVAFALHFVLGVVGCLKGMANDYCPGDFRIDGPADAIKLVLVAPMAIVLIAMCIAWASLMGGIFIFAEEFDL